MVFITKPILKAKKRNLVQKLSLFKEPSIYGYDFRALNVNIMMTAVVLQTN